jgi:hypothetical protein
LTRVNVGGHEQARAHTDLRRADRERDRRSDTIKSFPAELRIGVQCLAGRRLEVFNVISVGCTIAFAAWKRFGRSVGGHPWRCWREMLGRAELETKINKNQRRVKAWIGWTARCF